VLPCSDNFDLDDATLATANTVDGVDAKLAADNQPGHQNLSHRPPLASTRVRPRTVASLGSDNCRLPRNVLRPSGGSEGMLNAVISKPHQSAGCVRAANVALSACGPFTDWLGVVRPSPSPGGSAGPLQVSLCKLREHLSDAFVLTEPRRSRCRGRDGASARSRLDEPITAKSGTRSMSNGGGRALASA
jgi:hypothetical protein